MTDENTARSFMDDPAEFFNNSLTRMHSVTSDDLGQMQLTALKLRFAQQRERIALLGKLADAEGVKEINKFNDIVPLLFEHTIYKSYPASFLNNNRFQQLTKWLDKLSIHDLSEVDASGCEGMDDWFEVLENETPLVPITSSGTSGTMSVIPRDKSDWEKWARTLIPAMFQTFGSEPTPDQIEPNIHCIWPSHADGKTMQTRSARFQRLFIAGSDERFHPLYPEAASADVMLLASRLRAAAQKGELNKVEIPPRLLKKKHEYEEMNRNMSVRQKEFFKKITTGLAGERVLISGPWPMLYDLAVSGLAEGVGNIFAPDSVIMTGGGAKGLIEPEDRWEKIQSFFGAAKLSFSYAMSEVIAVHPQCKHERYHIMPWVIPFILDPDTSKPLPRSGVQKGRAAFMDLCGHSHWGGFITGDEIEIDWSPCVCGMTTPHVHNKIQRFSEIRGGSDKITCAAGPDAHAEALGFLNDLVE